MCRVIGDLGRHGITVHFVQYTNPVTAISQIFETGYDDFFMVWAVSSLRRYKHGMICQNCTRTDRILLASGSGSFWHIITVTSWWARLRLKPRASRLFSQPFVRHISKKTPKLCITGLCEGNPPTDSPHKGPVARKMFPLDDVIMHLWDATYFLLPVGRAERPFDILRRRYLRC